jgi:hypothetical protein
MRRLPNIHGLLLIGAMLVAGIGRAGEEVAPSANVLAALFTAAATNGGVRQIIVADDFENGIVQHVTRDPIGNETGLRYDAPAPRLRAFLSGVNPSNEILLAVSDEQAAAGAKSIRVQVPTGSQATLSWRFYGKDLPRRGKLKIAFDLLNNATAACDLVLGARDSSELRADKRRGQNTHFNLVCRPTAVRLGGAMSVTKGEWGHYELVLPLGDPAGKVAVTVTDLKLGVQSLEQPLENVANAVSMISLSVSGTAGGYVFLDNLVITVVE